MNHRNRFASLLVGIVTVGLMTAPTSVRAEPITTAPEMSAAEHGSNCKNIGNGDVCIRVGDIRNNRADITVWYSKHAGDPVFVRLAYFGRPSYDNGPFTISAGEVRGFIWYDQQLYDRYCFTGAILQSPPNWLVATKGGEVCR